MDPVLGAAAIGAGSSLIGGLFGSHNQKKQFKQDLAWQKELAHNQVQYHIEDMKKAGLNPMLAATSGMTVGGSSPSPASDQSGAMAAVFSDIAKTVINAGLQKEQIELERDRLSHQNNLTDAQADFFSAQSVTEGYKQQDLLFKIEHTNPQMLLKIRAEVDDIMAHNQLTMAQIKSEKVRTVLLGAQVSEAMSRINLNNSLVQTQATTRQKMLSEIILNAASYGKIESEKDLNNALADKARKDAHFVQLMEEFTGREIDIKDDNSLFSGIQAMAATMGAIGFTYTAFGPAFKKHNPIGF